MAEFAKGEFADLTRKAMGARTPFTFARRLQIKADYLENILKGTTANPPRINILQRIAQESEGRVEIKELSAAAGYEEVAGKPSLKKITEVFGIWEDFKGRHVNIAAFQEYLRQMMGGLNQSQFARKAGFTSQQINKWLRGEIRSLPSPESAMRIYAASDRKQDFKDFMASIGFPDVSDIMKPASVKFPEGLLEEAREAMEAATADLDENKNGQQKPKGNFEKKKVHAMGSRKNGQGNTAAKQTDNKRVESQPGKVLEIPAFNITSRDLAELAIIRAVKNPDDKVILLPSQNDEFRFELDGKEITYDLSLFDRDEANLSDVYLTYGRAATASMNGTYMIVLGNSGLYALFAKHPAPGLKTEILAILIDGTEIIDRARLA